MKVAIIADPLDNQSAGVHSYTRHLVQSMIRNRGSHEILLIREKEDPQLEGCRQIAVPNTRHPVGYASLRLFFIIPRLLKREEVDVVIEPAHFGPFNLPDTIKRVTMIHDLTPIIFPEFHRWHSSFLQRVFLKRILRKTDLILSNSNNTSRDLKRIFPTTENKIMTLHLGKDPYYKPVESRKALQRLGIETPYFHYVGTIEPRKDLNTLLEAYRLFRSAHPENRVQLVIAGKKGWKSNDFYTALESHPYRKDILITGYLPKETLPVLHTHSTAMIYPSLYEGFGLPVLEALSCGATVITCRNSSLTEVGGDKALYFETGDPRDLMKTMNVAMDMEITDKIREERIQWSDKFSWTDYARELFRKMEQLIKDHRK